MATEIRDRVGRLETVLGEFIVQTNMSLTRLERSIEAFKNEMQEFKDEMRQFKYDSERERMEMNKQWGSFAKKMGTIDEDLIAPALKPVSNKYFHCDVAMEGQRMFRRLEDRNYEIDAIDACM